MNRDALENYIRKKISEIDQDRDIKEYVRKGRFNFGMNQQEYGHLPSWPNLVKGKRKLVRLIWLQAFLSALMMYAFMEDWDQPWLKTLMKMLIGATIFTLFYNITSYFSIAFEVNRVQKQVQKLLYEDVLHWLAEENAMKKAATTPK